MIKNKKSQLLGFVMMIVLIIIIAIILTYTKVALDTQTYIGGKQNTAFQAYSAGENARTFISSSAKYSGMAALKTLESDGVAICDENIIVPPENQDEFKDYFYFYFYFYVGLHPVEYPDFNLIIPSYEDTELSYVFDNTAGKIVVAASMNDNPIQIFVENPLMIYSLNSGFKEVISCTDYLGAYREVI